MGSNYIFSTHTLQGLACCTCVDENCKFQGSMLHQKQTNLAADCRRFSAARTRCSSDPGTGEPVACTQVRRGRYAFLFAVSPA